MAFFLFSLISLLGFIHLSLQNEDRLQFVSTETDWESAQNKCTDAQRILMSEKPIASSLAEVEPGEVTWTNAKVTWIEYASGLVEYLKLAYMHSDTFLENCICVNNNGMNDDDSGMKACARTKTSVNWTDAHKKCTFDGDAWDPLQASKLKNSVAMLDKGPSVWLSKFTLNDLDNSVSMCVCLERLEDGNFVERLDNCSNSHSYVCAMDPARYAPTLTRLEVKIPELAKDDGDSGESTNSVHQDDDLVIEFFRQRTNSSTYQVNDPCGDNTSTERLNIVCRLNNIPNILKFSYIYLSRQNNNCEYKSVAIMQEYDSNENGYRQPKLYRDFQLDGTFPLGTYSRTNPTLGISMPVSALNCNETNAYVCRLEYSLKTTDPDVRLSTKGIKRLKVSDGLVIELFKQRADHSTYQVYDVCVNTNTSERLNIVCRANNTQNSVMFHLITLYTSKYTNFGYEEVARMQDTNSSEDGYKEPFLVDRKMKSAGIQAIGTYGPTNPTLGISIPVSALICNETYLYWCRLNYDYAERTKDSIDKRCMDAVKTIRAPDTAVDNVTTTIRINADTAADDLTIIPTTTATKQQLSTFPL